MPPAAQPTLYRSHSASAPPSRSRMPSLFNTIRASLYGTVLLFTIICLAMAAHFQTMLAASDLTRFVPFAIFVCSASLLIYTILLSFSFFFKERNPISTRIELACLGLTGIFWLALGAFLVTSEAQDADVECFSQQDGVTPLDMEVTTFHTDQYQAMYRVLNAFSLMNAALILFACLALLFLALRRHRMGDEHMWHGPVTSCAWFNTYVSGKPGASTGRSNSRSAADKSASRPILPIATGELGKPVFTEKPERKASARREYRERERGGLEREPSSRSYHHNDRSGGDRDRNDRDRERERDRDRPYQSRNPYPVPPKTTQPNYSSRLNAGGYSRSPQLESTVPDVENGGMLNPYSNRMRGGGR